MRNSLLVAGLLFFIVANVFADSPLLPPASVGTSAQFAVDNNRLLLSSVIAIIEPRLGAPGYSWVRIHFYSFPPAAGDMAGMVRGNVDSMDKKWEKLADRHDNSYNLSNAIIQLSVDKDYKV